MGEAEDEGRKPSLEGEEFRGCLVASRRCNSRQWKSQTGRGGLLLGGGRHGGYGRNKSNDGTCTGYGEEEEERYRGGGFRRDGGLNDPRGGEGAEEDDDLDEEGAAACSRRSAREGSVRMMKFPPFPSRVVLADEAMRTQIRCCGAVMKGELEAVKKWESIRGHQGDRILQLGNEPLQVFDTFGKLFSHAYLRVGDREKAPSLRPEAPPVEKGQGERGGAQAARGALSLSLFACALES